MKLSTLISFSICLFEGQPTASAATTKKYIRRLRSTGVSNQSPKKTEDGKNNDPSLATRMLPQMGSSVFDFDLPTPSKEKNTPAQDLRGNGGGVETRIVGGDSSEVGQFPYFVDMLQARCGGTLIAPRVVLTAAHCDKENNRWTGLDVLVGAVEDNEEKHGAVEVKVQETILHPIYDPDTNPRQQYDFQLVLLEEPVYINDGPIASIVEDANAPDTPPGGTKLRVMGIGRLEYGGDRTDWLRDVEVPVVDIDQCISMYEKDDKDVDPDCMFCAGDIEDGGIDSCSGDSGGPIVLEQNATRHVVKGVVSWGTGCADEDYPGVYAKVSSIYGWIQSVACGEDGWNVEADFCEGYGLTNEGSTNEGSTSEGGNSTNPVNGTSVETSLPACTSVPNFETKFGTCETYASGEENHPYCYWDVDEDSGVLAKDACAECGECVIVR